MPRSKGKVSQRKIATEWITFRRHYRFSQRRLAEALGISRRTVQYVETGHAQQPSWSCIPSEATLERFRELQIQYANEERSILSSPAEQERRRRLKRSPAYSKRFGYRRQKQNQTQLPEQILAKAFKVAVVEAGDLDMMIQLIRITLDDHHVEAAQAIAGKPARKAASTRQPKNRQPVLDQRIHLVKQRTPQKSTVQSPTSGLLLPPASDAAKARSQLK